LLRVHNEEERMKALTFSLVAAAASLAAVAAAPAPAEAQQRQRCVAVTPAQVEAQFDRFNAAWATRDPDQVTALFARDAVLLATVSNRPRTDHAGIRDYFIGFLRGAPVGTINSSNVHIGCNIATRVGTWTVNIANAEGVRSDVRARYSFIYRYEGGRWVIAHLHSSMMPEPAPAT
jgi:uncharacterized protein (TIGR02246 family)